MGTTYYLAAPRLRLAFTLPNLSNIDIEDAIVRLDQLRIESEGALDTSEVTVQGMTLKDLERLVSTYDIVTGLGYDLPIVAFVERIRAYDKDAFVVSEHDPQMAAIDRYRVIDLDPSKP